MENTNTSLIFNFVFKMAELSLANQKNLNQVGKLIRNIGWTNCKLLFRFVFNMGDQSDVNIEDKTATHSQELAELARLGFPVSPLSKKVAGLDAVWSYAKELEQMEAELAFPIDGMVVKLDDNGLKENLGIVGKTPRGWCAIKFKADQTTTTVIGVSWQVGRTGKITPVAELEAVELQGTTVKRATLHNYKEFLEKKLVAGDTVVVHKAGDIIPEVLQVLVNLRVAENQNFIAPNICPECGEGVVFSATKIDMLCPNTDTCPAQVIGRLSYFTGRNLGNIDGLSGKIIEKLAKEFGVADIPDLYWLDYGKIAELEGFGAKSAENLERSVGASRVLPAHKFLAGLGIDGIGIEVAKLIVEKLSEKRVEKKEIDGGQKITTELF